MTTKELLLEEIATAPDELLLELLGLLRSLKAKTETHLPFYKTATPAERAQAFRDWAASHRSGMPLLSDYAVSRESFYEDEQP
jgi:hypothetical protein